MCRSGKIVAIAFILLSCEHKEFLNPYDPENLPPAPKLVTPANDVVCPQNPPYFQWDIEEDTLNLLHGEGLIYCIQIGNDSDFSSIRHADSSIPVRSCLPSTLLDDEVYFWRVRAKYPNGGWGEWSDTRSLRVRFPVIGSCNVWASGEMAINQNAVYLASGSKLYIVDVANPENPRLLSVYEDTSLSFSHIFIANNYLYTTYTDYFEGQLSVYNITDPSRPVPVGRLPLSYEHAPDGLWIDGNKAYVCAQLRTLIIDVGNPDSLTVVDSFAVTGDIIVSRNYAYLLQSNALIIVDLANKNVVASIVCHCNSMSISANNLYLAGSLVSIYDISNPAAPTLKSTINKTAGAVHARGSRLFFVHWGHEEVAVYDVTDPANPGELGSVKNIAGEIIADNNFAYVSQPDLIIVKHE